MTEFGIEESLQQFTRDIETGFQDVSLEPSQREKEQQAMIDLEDIQSRIQATEEQDLETIKKYGSLALGVVGVGALGLTVLNKLTAKSATELYDEPEIKTEPVDVTGQSTKLTNDEYETMNTMSKLTQIVYDRRYAAGNNFLEYNPAFRKREKDIENQDFGDYRFESTTTDLASRFVNDNDKKVVIAIRGLMPLDDRADFLQFPEMLKKTALETQSAFDFGKTFRADRKMLDAIYFITKREYPDYEIITTGHSRGGRGSMYLGRKYDLEYHSFSPAANRGDLTEYVPRDKGTIYYNIKDPTSKHLKNQRGKTAEKHIVSYNNRNYPHSLKDFNNNGKFHNQTTFIREPTIIENIQKVEKENIDEVLKMDTEYIIPEDMVDADFGNFWDPEKISDNAPILETGYGRTTDRGIFVNVNKRPVSSFKPNISLFQLIDKNNDKEITLQELKAYYPELSDEELLILFKRLDKNGDGKITINEFYA